MIAETTVKDRRFVTVMFVDICNSTGLYNSMDDEDITKLFSKLIAECRPIIENNSGILNQTTGDGLYAVFGADGQNNEFQALSACIASEKIQNLFAGEPALKIGIHSGYVSSTTGEVFNDMAIHLIGKPVHIAAHICNAAKENETLLSADAYELVKNYTLCNTTKTRFKNYEKPAYHLVHTLYSGNKFAHFKDFLLKEETMFGRDIELQAILDHANRAFSEKSNHIHLEGEAGIGKTRMIYSVLEALNQEKQSLSIFSCLPLPQTVGNIDALNFLVFEVMRNLGYYKVDAENLDDIVQELGLGAQEFRSILMESYEFGKSKGYSKSEKASIKSELVVRLLTQLSLKAPTIFIIDDVHRVAGDLKLLYHNLQSKLGEGRFFLLTASKRADFSNSLLDSNIVKLRGLREADIKSLISSHLTEGHASVLSKRQIFEKSNGNPYFATQISKFLKNTPHGEFTPDSYFQISESLDSLFAFQLGDLQDAVLETLTCAALIGKEFSLTDIQIILQTDLQGIVEHLNKLIELDWIRPYGPLSTRYEFNHEISLYAIRRSLTRSKTQSMHLRIFKAVRNRKVRLTGTRVQQMAHHAFHSGLYSIAYACGLISGKTSLKESLAGNAEKYLNIAFESFTRLPLVKKSGQRRAQLLFLRAKAYSLNGYPNRALQILETDTSARNELHTPNSTLGLSYQELSASLKWITSDYTRDDITNFERQADPSTPLGMNIFIRCSGMLTDRGLFEDSTERLMTILSSFYFDDERANYGLLFPAESTCYSLISKNYAETNSFFLADQYAIRALESVAEWEYTHQKIFVLTFSSFTSLYQKQYQKALSLLNEAQILTRKFGIDLIAPLVYSTHAYADYFVNQDTRNIAVIQNVLDDMERRGIQLRKSKYHLYLAKIYQDLGDMNAMHEQCKIAHTISKQLNEPHIRIKTSLMMARLYSLSGVNLLPIASPGTLLEEAQECAKEYKLEMLFSSTDSDFRYFVTN